MKNASRQIRFPDPRLADAEGLIAVGGDWGTDILLQGYRQGVFPWPIDEIDKIPWFSPDPRAVLFFDELHTPRSLARFLKRHPYRVSWGEAFPAVLRACEKQKRPGQRGSWITPELRAGYEQLFSEGHAWSCEVWEEEKLVGGIYGVLIDGRICSGESMFHKRDNASKLALIEAVSRLRELGLKWMDIQVMTPHLKALGAREIPRAEFLGML